MRCCGSPTTFTARDVAAPSTREVAASPARDVAAAFDAMLVREAFSPLAMALGSYGDVVVDAAARTLARAERGGLTDALERAIDAARATAARRVDA